GALAQRLLLIGYRLSARAHSCVENQSDDRGDDHSADADDPAAVAPPWLYFLLRDEWVIVVGGEVYRSPRVARVFRRVFLRLLWQTGVCRRFICLLWLQHRSTFPSLTHMTRKVYVSLFW